MVEGPEDFAVGAHHVVALIDLDELDKFLPFPGIKQIGSRKPRIKRIDVIGRGIALVEVIEVLLAAQENAAQYERLDVLRIFDGIGQGESAAPATAKNVHRPLDAEMLAKQIDVVDQIIGGIAFQCLLGQPGIVVAGAWRALAAAALVEQDDPIAARIEKSRLFRTCSATRPAMQKHDRSPLGRAILMPIDRMVRAGNLEPAAIGHLVWFRIFPDILVFGTRIVGHWESFAFVESVRGTFIAAETGVLQLKETS